MKGAERTISQQVYLVLSGVSRFLGGNEVFQHTWPSMVGSAASQGSLLSTQNVLTIVENSSPVAHPGIGVDFLCILSLPAQGGSLGGNGHYRVNSRV